MIFERLDDLCTDAKGTHRDCTNVIAGFLADVTPPAEHRFNEDPLFNQAFNDQLKQREKRQDRIVQRA